MALMTDVMGLYEGGEQVLPGEAGFGAGGGLPHQRRHRVGFRTERGGPRASASGWVRVPAGALWLCFGVVVGVVVGVGLC